MLRFFLVALVVIAAMQGYVMWHVWRLLPLAAPLKVVVMLIMLVALGCLIGQFASDGLPLPAATAVYEIGNSWLIIAFYLLMIFVVLDLCRLFHLIPASWLHGNAVTTLVITALMLVTFVGGNLHYRHKVRQAMTFSVSQPLDKPLRIVFVSDLHAGFHNPSSEIGRWVDLINAEQPDLILIGGDLIDGNVRPLLAQGTADELRRLAAPAYACPGNHDYMAGIDKATQFCQQAGIHLLRDQVATVDGGVTIIGRDDRSNPQRMPLAQLMAGTDPATCRIVLDHQPYNLEQAEQCGANLQLSGHTHHGQVWPLNWVTQALYECDYGAHKRGNTDYYISSGIGIWGGKFRIGTSSEYAVIELKGR